MAKIEWKGWNPTWRQMREAVAWSKRNHHMVGDYRTIRQGALAFLEGLRVTLLEAIQVAAQAIVDEGHLHKEVPDWYVNYSHLRDLKNALIDYHFAR